MNDRSTTRKALKEPGVAASYPAINKSNGKIKGLASCFLFYLENALVHSELSDTPGQSGSPAVLPGVFSQLPGSCLIGVSHFPDSGPEVLRSSFPGPAPHPLI